jgi:RNA polymerase sigma-70 factor (ECF subfamily)
MMTDANATAGATHDEDPEALKLTAVAVSQLFREHNRALVGYLTARLRSQQEAEEVAQEAYVRLLQLQEPGTPSLFRSYLFKTATNLAIDRLRRRSVRQRIEQSEWRQDLNPSSDVADDPARQLLASERAEELRRYVAELPAKCRRVLQMHRVDGLTQQEVAKRLGLSDRMVRRYVTYAMVYCRLRLEGIPADAARQQVTL